MKYGVTYNQAGQVIPAGLHIPQNLALFPYIPHPLQLAGQMNFFPTLGQSGAIAGVGPAAKATARAANSGTEYRPL